MTYSGIFTAASVTEGHPDKLCDQISDAIVDAHLVEDPEARIIAECAVTRGILFLAVRASRLGAVDVAAVARRVIGRAGYAVNHGGFSATGCTITSNIVEAADGLRAVPDGLPPGLVGDGEAAEQQTTVFGYACDETPTGLPAPLWYAHLVARELAGSGRDGRIPALAPDGQAQVAVEYRDGRPIRLHAVTVLAASRLGSSVGLDAFRNAIRREVVERALDGAGNLATDGVQVVVNPTGLVLRGGPDLHAGLTGRKTAIDTYGESARHGGAALSGKDPGRIDRAAAYAARHAARNVVAVGLATRCEVFISYDIGRADPVSFGVECFGTGMVGDAEIAARLRRIIDFRPRAIRERFRLRALPAERGGTFYESLAAYGQMGRDDLAPPWEATDLVADLG